MLSVLYRFYTYLYYRLYRWNLKTWGEGDFPHINAMLGVSFLICVNLFAVLALLEVLIKANIITTPISVGLLLIAYCIGYYAFLYRQKYRQFGEVFADETPRRRVVNALLLWLYALGSFGVLLIIGRL